MKKWYQWFYLSLGFAAGGIINYFDGKQTTGALIQVSITVAFGFLQFFCDRKGERGRKVFQRISTAVIVLLVIWLISLILRMWL